MTTRLSDHSSPLDRNAELPLHRDTLLHQIVLHLNPVDVEDQRIKTLANRIQEISDKGDQSTDLPDALIDLREATGNYLKKEWNRVKNESEGTRS